MAESCSNDGVDVVVGGGDVVGGGGVVADGGDGKRKVDCEGEVDDDDGDNDKADCDDDADGGGNSKDDGDEDGIFENWCVDGEGGDDPDDGYEQTESAACGLAKCSRSSEMEMTKGEM